jgi:hypothetical protein
MFLGGEVKELKRDQNALCSTLFFHFMLVCATGMMGMTLTNWSLRGTPGRLELDRGEPSMWMKMSMQWFCSSLYGVAVSGTIWRNHLSHGGMFDRSLFV